MLATLELNQPDRVPVVPFIITYAAKYAGVRFVDYCSKPNSLVEAQLKTVEDHGIDAVYVDSDPVVEAEAMGCEAKYGLDEVPCVAEPFVKEFEDVEALRIPDPLRDCRMPVWIEAVEKLKEKAGDKYAVFANVNGPFQVAAQLRGIANMCVDLYRSPQMADKLIRISAEVVARFVEAEVKAGVDAIVMGEAMASPNVISPRLFERFVLPYDRKVIEAGRGVPFFLHICGDSTLIIDRMVQTGARFLEVDSQVDLAEIRRRYGNRVGIRGNVSPMLLLNGTPEEVEEESRRCIHSAARGGGFILGSGCEVPRDTPAENLKAMVRAAEKYGRYE
ncbi:MAG: uroporphyrinogen decarboxylase family protein [Candidatus Bathyarchaeia archaeon]